MAVFDFDWLAQTYTADSSYQRHDLGWFIYGVARAHNPKVVVELGVLNGYSLLFLGAAVRDCGGGGHVWGYDRWPHHIPNAKEQVEDRIQKAGLSEYVSVETADVLKRVPYPPVQERIDLLNVDLDNCGYWVDWARTNYGPAMSDDGVIIFEGGTPERDSVEWMGREKRIPMRKALDALGPNWASFTVPLFPGVTIVQRAYGSR